MELKTCTFFGHKDAPQIVKLELQIVLSNLIGQGVKQFYVGNQGNFDAMVTGVLKELEQSHRIHYEVVLAYMPKREDSLYDSAHTVLPEGIEAVPPRFAIDYRNKWMLECSDIVVTYVCRSFGGAAKFKELAKRKNKTVIELYNEKPQFPF